MAVLLHLKWQFCGSAQPAEMRWTPDSASRYTNAYSDWFVHTLALPWLCFKVFLLERVLPQPPAATAAAAWEGRRDLTPASASTGGSADG